VKSQLPNLALTERKNENTEKTLLTTGIIGLFKLCPKGCSEQKEKQIYAKNSNGFINADSGGKIWLECLNI